MKKYAQLQYQGYNLLDEVGTVEVAIDREERMIHVYDTQQIVAPEYDFATKNYRLTDSFYQMATIIRRKNFLQMEDALSIEQWVKNSTWYFYTNVSIIKRYADGEMTTEDMKQSKWVRDFYLRYMERTI